MFKHYLLIIASVAACAGDSTESTEERGFTMCGQLTCQPNQHCADGLFCENGCLSNANCGDDQTCEDISSVTHVGTCRGSSQPDAGMQVSELQRCMDAGKRLVQCGLIDIAEGAQWNSDCQSATDPQRKALGDCILPWSCSQPLPGCLSAHIQCGPSYPCSGGQQCVDHTCI